MSYPSKVLRTPLARGIVQVPLDAVLNNRIKSMNENDTITEGRAAVSSNETKRTAEGYYYVSPGSSVTLVALGESVRYWWMGGDNPYGGGTCKVASGELGGTGTCTHFTALGRCTGGYLLVQGRHRVLKSCGNSIMEVASARPTVFRKEKAGDLVRLAHAPGAVAVFAANGDVHMFGHTSESVIFESELRLYGNVFPVGEPETLGTREQLGPYDWTKCFKEDGTKCLKEPDKDRECGHLVSGGPHDVDAAEKVDRLVLAHMDYLKRKARRTAEHEKRDDDRYNSIDTSSCKVYSTREDERWVFFSHNGCAEISPLESDGQADNTFRTAFVGFNKGTNIPYVCVDGGRMWALRGEHSAAMLSGPILDRSKLFQVYPSKIEGEHDFWRMVYTRPDRYRLLVVPMSGGAVVQKDCGSLLDVPDIMAQGTSSVNGPCLMSGSYKSITVLSGECMVFALHESLKILNHDRYNGFDAVVNDADRTLWLPMLHNTSFQWNRESRDASYVRRLCMGIPYDVAPDETAVALYRLDKGRGIIRAVGGDVYYSLETHDDAYNVSHADGKIEDGNAVVVDTGEFTGIALYGPHDIRPLEEGQSPDKGDGICLVVKPDLEMHYGGGDDGSVVSVRIDGNMVDLPKGYRRSKAHSIRYAAREILFREECDRNKAQEQEAEKEPPCPDVEPHDGLQGYIKVLFRGCRWETGTGKPLPEHYGPNCYVLVPENRMCEICSVKFMQDVIRIVNDWAAPYALQSYEDSRVTGICATDRMGSERVMPCDEDGNALFYTVQFKDVRWIKDGKDCGGQSDLEVRVPKGGLNTLEIDGRSAGSIIGEAVLKAEEGRDAAMYYRNVYFVC